MGGEKTIFVSIPFRADTGFERNSITVSPWEEAQFQSLSGLTLGLNDSNAFGLVFVGYGVSIPFRADTGFELCWVQDGIGMIVGFQSLSGLTLGLNCVSHSREKHKAGFQSLSGLTLGLNLFIKPTQM